MSPLAQPAIDWNLLHTVVDADPTFIVHSRPVAVVRNCDALDALHTISDFLDEHPECQMLSLSVERPLKYPEVCVAACVRSTWRTEWEDATGTKDILAILATDLNTQFSVVTSSPDLPAILAACTKVNSGSDREYLLSALWLPECVEKAVGPDAWAQYKARQQAAALSAAVAAAPPKNPLKM